MTNGDEIRRARERAGLTQEQLASRVGVTLRTVGNWERGATVPRNRLAAVQAALAGHLDDAGGETGLRSASDVELLAEIARRFARTYSREEVTGDGEQPAAMTRAGGSPATTDRPVLTEGRVLDRARGSREPDPSGHGGSPRSRTS